MDVGHYAAHRTDHKEFSCSSLFACAAHTHSGFQVFSHIRSIDCSRTIVEQTADYESLAGRDALQTETAEAVKPATSGKFTKKWEPLTPRFI